MNSEAFSAVLTGNGEPFSEFGACPSIAPAGLDTVALSVTGVPDTPALLFKGTTSINGGLGIPFGDGLRCCGRQVTRGEIQVGAGNTLEFGWPNSKLSETTQSCGGVTYCYQVWYRDTFPVCGGPQFNLTNAVEISWIP